MKIPQYSTEFPIGIPIPSGAFGSCTHNPGTYPIPLIHSDWDLIFIDEGHADFTLKNHRPLYVPKDHFLLLPPFVTVWFQSPKSLLRLWFCHFTFVQIPNGVFPSVRSDCMENEIKVMIPLIFSKKDAPNVWLAYRNLLYSTHVRSKGPKWKITSAILRLVTELAAFAMQRTNNKRIMKSTDLTVGLDHRLEELCRKIIDQPGYPWISEELAKSVCLSKGHLDRIFLSALGISLKQYVFQARFKLALRLLANVAERHKSIKEISAMCGFSSQELFARNFKKLSGITPSEYRIKPQMLTAKNKSIIGPQF